MLKQVFGDKAKRVNMYFESEDRESVEKQMYFKII